ncbi:hypothetical protein ABIA35_004933 [Catenulispora sp. MAP12-49]|uniref:hypothetical protein n=1 Tax=Catenulispora sp. MAP12-49 TaxID=3156302 RepID=UPI003512279C
MDAEQLRDFYARSVRGRETADREFAERTHGWHFELLPEAAQWADEHAAGERWSSGGTAVVELADAAGVIGKPEPGRIGSAYSHRDPMTEQTTATGFGFWPRAADALVVHAGRAVPVEALEAPAERGDGAAVLAMLRLVVESFATVRAFSDPPGTPRS